MDITPEDLAMDLANAEWQIAKYMEQFKITREEAIVHLDDYDREIIANAKDQNHG